MDYRIECYHHGADCLKFIHRYYLKHPRRSASARSCACLVLFLSTDIAHLGFCLRPKSSISDHWSSHRVRNLDFGIKQNPKYATSVDKKQN